MDKVLCERDIWPRLYKALVEVRVFGCAVYDIKSESPPEIELAGIWTHSPRDEAAYKEIDTVQRARALRFLQENHDHIIRHPSCPANKVGERWWQFVLASGAVRRAGYVVCALVAAKDQGDVERSIGRVQGVFDQHVQPSDHSL